MKPLFFFLLCSLFLIGCVPSDLAKVPIPEIPDINLIPPEPKTETIIQEQATANKNLNVRKGAGTKFLRIGRFTKNTTATILETQGNWVHISNETITGWVYKPYVKIEEITVTRQITQNTTQNTQRKSTQSKKIKASKEKEGGATSTSVASVAGDLIDIFTQTPSSSGTSSNTYSSRSTRKPTTNLEKTQEWLKEVAKKPSEAECKARYTAEQPTLKDKLISYTIQKILDAGISEITGIKKLERVKKIRDTCTADKRLKYVRKGNKELNGKMNIALSDLDNCYASHGEGKLIESEAQQAKRHADVIGKRSNKVAEELAEKIKTVTSEGREKCVNSSVGSLKGLSSYAGTTLGWTKELFEFGQDNSAWAVRNANLIKETALTAKDVASAVTTVSLSIVQPIVATMTPYDKQKVAALERETLRKEKTADAKKYDF